MLVVAVAPLYTRIGRDEALGHSTRAHVHAYLRDHPGASRREMCQALNLHPMTLLHHLEVLTTLGLVSARREGREVLYTLGGPLPMHPSLRAQARRRIAQHIAKHALSQSELSSLTGLSQRLVAYHLARMADVLQIFEGRPRRYRLRDEAAQYALD